MHFGATLRLLRTDAGLSLRQLAQAIGVSSAYLSRVEHGHDQAPTPDRLVAIARTLGLPSGLLLELADRVGSFVSNYLDAVPAANALFLDIARRGLTPAQLGRVRAYIDSEFPASAPHGDAGSLHLPRLLSDDHVLLRLSCTDLTDALDLAASLFMKKAPAQTASLASAMRRREQEAPSALGDGVAAPHAIVQGASPEAALLTLERPLVCATPDGAPLRVLVVLLLDAAGGKQLHVLAQVARLAEPHIVDALVAAESPRSARQVIENVLG